MKDDRAYLLHIHDAISRIEQYTSGGEESFLSSPIVQDAVIRNLEVIGEATKALSAETKASEPAIPWKSIAGMRDKLIHHYFGVSLRLVWTVVDSELPRLRAAVDRLLSA